MPDRPPSFKPINAQWQAMTLCGPVQKRDGQQMTWTDDKNNTFYLYTLANENGQEYTWFLKGHQARMLLERVPYGQQFQAMGYGRPKKGGGFFGDVAIMYGGVEYRAEDWDQGPDTRPPGTQPVAAAPQVQPANPQPQPQQPQGPQQPQRRVAPPAQAQPQAQGPQGKPPADDVGMMAECIRDAGLVLYSEPVQRVLDKVGGTVTVEDIMTRAASLFIQRNYHGENGPRHQSFSRGNLQFRNPNPQETEPQGDDSSQQQNQGQEQETHPEGADMTFPPAETGDDGSQNLF